MIRRSLLVGFSLAVASFAPNSALADSRPANLLNAGECGVQFQEEDPLPGPPLNCEVRALVDKVAVTGILGTMPDGATAGVAATLEGDSYA